MNKLLPELNVGVVGHVDNGKTTLISSLTGRWTSLHSEEIKRGITIKLGYVDVVLAKCVKCGDTAGEKCTKCGSKTQPQRMISFVDAPGHETLMAVMISGAAIMDAALLLVAANEECPQPQTIEHLMVLKILGIKKILVVQNKIDLVNKAQAMKNYNQIKQLLKETLGFEVPIIPISAVRKVNLNFLVEAMQEQFKTPERNEKAEPRMLIARSFDINKPGSEIANLKGGILGGAIIQGKLAVGKEIELRPGIKKEVKNQTVWEPVKTKIDGIVIGGQFVESRGSGGSVAIATQLDPSITKGDSLVGNIVGYPDKLPPVLNDLNLKVTLFDKVVGMKADIKIEPLKMHEPLMLSCGTATTLGFVLDINKVRLKLKRPICSDKGSNVALSRQFNNRWHLIGMATII